MLFLPDLQENESRDDQADQDDRDNRFRGHALRLLSQIAAFLHHNDQRGDKPAEKKKDTATKRREFPPVGVHTELHELMVLNLDHERVPIGMFLSQFDLLSGNREVSIRRDAFLDPDCTERKTVDGDLTGPVRDHVGNCSLRIEEVAAIRFLPELQDFKVGFALNLDAEASACQRIAGLRVDLLDLQAGRAVLDIHNLRSRNTVFISESEGDHFLPDITLREHLFNRVGTYGQICFNCARKELKCTETTYKESSECSDSYRI